MQNILIVALILLLPKIAFSKPIKIKSYGYDAKAQVDVIHDFDASTIVPEEGAYREFMVAQIPMKEAANAIIKRQLALINLVLAHG